MTDTNINGELADLESITLIDDNGSGFTYYKLRDLGAALGFEVNWDKDLGVVVNTKVKRNKAKRKGWLFAIPFFVSGSPYFLATASFRALPGLKAGTSVAGILISSLV